MCRSVRRFLSPTLRPPVHPASTKSACDWPLRRSPFVPTFRSSTDDPFHSVTRTDSNVTTMPYAAPSSPHSRSLFLLFLLCCSREKRRRPSLSLSNNAFFPPSSRAGAACGNARTGFQPDLRERSMARGEISRRNVIWCWREVGRKVGRQTRGKRRMRFLSVTFSFSGKPEGCLSKALNDDHRSLFGPKRPSAVALAPAEGL